MLKAREPTKHPARDHRVDVAEKKRLLMRTRLVDATMRVYGNSENATPVIDDVISEAKVSRGTFYNYFNSLDEVLIVIGQDLSNQMTTEILPVYNVLTEPWQRFSVGFRLFLIRALLDRKWAGFVTRTSAWAEDSLVAQFMSRDLEHGRTQGQFNFDDVEVAADFLKGASAHGIQALRTGVNQPGRYIDYSVRMALASLGCKEELRDKGTEFSKSYLKDWLNGELKATRPAWAFSSNVTVRHDLF
ncbi:transcriptional regulator (plasmid) [Burkholderia sp. PAMC 28687]|uniref:TetR/AcrR family transcriptional regulator n=1 Tax=Burkholderia sp. PAMC 28687 TaxID=1795874 RepID=UPI000786644D|nr:TetR/AcrR family transcriptional regulator [Burkholderia sp. PAMC 28687]AMM18543.1 transcriptional regulator [Burkholderia sp. PAMC 28687]